MDGRRHASVGGGPIQGVVDWRATGGWRGSGGPAERWTAGEGRPVGVHHCRGSGEKSGGDGGDVELRAADAPSAQGERATRRRGQLPGLRRPTARRPFHARSMSSEKNGGAGSRRGGTASNPGQPSRAYKLSPRVVASLSPSVVRSTSAPAALGGRETDAERGRKRDGARVLGGRAPLCVEY